MPLIVFLAKVKLIVSEKVVIHLIRTICVPILSYGLEALPLNKSQLTSLDFVVNRFFMKLFKTTDMQVVEICRDQFNFVLPSMQVDHRRTNFVSSPVTTDLVKLFLCNVVLIVVYSATISR